MRERGILMSGPMVRALLDGRKTQTRRIVKFRDCNDDQSLHNVWRAWNGKSHDWQDGDEIIRCPYGVPGDRLWVRETWGCKAADRPGVSDGRRPQPGDSIQYAANDADAWQWRDGSLPWRPSIHMPRWAARLTLTITDVRVQRVQDIDGDDALAEGVQIPVSAPSVPLLRMSSRVPFALASPKHPREWGRDEYARFEFLHLFYDINKRASVDANPWVWALTFTVEQSHA